MANSVDAFVDDRQKTRFGKMTEEVKDMLGRFSGSKTLSANDFRDERQRLRKGGYNQAEEDAIMNTFAKTHGQSAGALMALQAAPSYNEGDVVAPGQAFTPDSQNTASPPTPFGKIDPPGFHEVLQNLLQNAMRAGRTPFYGEDKPRSFEGFDV